jgi:SAM-dependent methyltransferase
MPDVSTAVRRLLAWPPAYHLVENALGSPSARRRLVAEHIRPRPAARLLDIGCGPADVLAALPQDVRYFGFDKNPAYVEAARRRGGDRAVLRCLSVETADVGGRQFDIVLAMGILHHLDDAAAEALLALAARSLVPAGRFIATDCTLVERQSPVARWLIERDRGEHIRLVAGYAGLAEPWFESVDVRVRGDLLRVPYTHAVLQCAEPRASGSASS